jgi:hypothetical protein
LVIQVDLVEPVSHFLEAARENLTGGMMEMDQGEDSHKAVNFYCVPLQVSMSGQCIIASDPNSSK